MRHLSKIAMLVSVLALLPIAQAGDVPVGNMAVVGNSADDCQAAGTNKEVSATNAAIRFKATWALTEEDNSRDKWSFEIDTVWNTAPPTASTPGDDDQAATEIVDTYGFTDTRTGESTSIQWNADSFPISGDYSATVTITVRYYQDSTGWEGEEDDEHWIELCKRSATADVTIHYLRDPLSDQEVFEILI